MVHTSHISRNAGGTSACVITRNPVTFGVCKSATTLQINSNDTVGVRKDTQHAQSPALKIGKVFADCEESSLNHAAVSGTQKQVANGNHNPCLMASIPGQPG